MKIKLITVNILLLFAFIVSACIFAGNAHAAYDCDNFCAPHLPGTPEYDDCCYCVDYCQPLPPGFKDFHECYDDCRAGGKGGSTSGGGGGSGDCPCTDDGDCKTGEYCYLGFCYFGGSPSDDCKGSGSGSGGSGGGSGGASNGSSGLGGGSGGKGSGGSTGGSGGSNPPICPCQSKADCNAGEYCINNFCYIDPNTPSDQCSGGGGSNSSTSTGGSSGGSTGSGGGSGGSTGSGGGSGGSTGSGGGSGGSTGSGGGSGGSTGSGGSSGGSTGSGGSGGSSGAAGSSSGGICSQGQSACSTEISNLWGCAYPQCGNIPYTWCDQAEKACSNHYMALQNCVDPICNPGGGGSGGGGGSVGFTYVPYMTNLVSATADQPPHNEVNQTLYLYNPRLDAGPKTGDKLNDIRSQFTGYAKGGPTDYVAYESSNVAVEIADKMFKDCFESAGQDGYDYYNGNAAKGIVGMKDRAKGVSTGKYNFRDASGNYLPLPNYPVIDCQFFLDAAGIP